MIAGNNRLDVIVNRFISPADSANHLVAAVNLVTEPPRISRRPRGALWCELAGRAAVALEKRRGNSVGRGSGIRGGGPVTGPALPCRGGSGQ